MDYIKSSTLDIFLIHSMNLSNLWNCLSTIPSSENHAQTIHWMCPSPNFFSRCTGRAILARLGPWLGLRNNGFDDDAPKTEEQSGWRWWRSGGWGQRICWWRPQSMELGGSYGGGPGAAPSTAASTVMDGEVLITAAAPGTVASIDTGTCVQFEIEATHTR